MGEKCPWKEFGQRLRKYRHRIKVSSPSLARNCDLSPSYISHLEKGERRPSYVILCKIADQLNLREGERRTLFAAVNYSVEDLQPQDGTEHLILRKVAKIFRDSQIAELEKQTLAEEIDGLIRKWSNIRRKKICKVVIPIAGWQSRILSNEETEKMLIPAIEEARNSGIDQFIIVKAPKRADPLRGQYKVVRYITQDEQLGLGHAILLARKEVGEEPFGVILPDDIISTLQGRFEPCLKQMKDLYEIFKSSIIAVRPVTKIQEFKSFGIISLADEVKCTEGLEGRLYLVDSLEEKPRQIDEEGLGSDKKAVVGRYILTPEIFRFLEEMLPYERREIQLTDALERLLQTGQRLYAYMFKGGLFSIAPMRLFYEKLLDLVMGPQNSDLDQGLQEVIEIIREGLYYLSD